MQRILSAAVIASVLLPTSVLADTAGKWKSGEINGFTRYWTTNSDGANFVVWCHPKRSINGTLLHIDIDGKMPPAHTKVKVILDREVMELPINEQGYVETSCAACSDSFGYVWHRLRSSHSLVVKFQDDRYAGFSLRGAQKIIPGDVCPTDWQKLHPR